MFFSYYRLRPYFDEHFASCMERNAPWNGSKNNRPITHWAGRISRDQCNEVYLTFLFKARENLPVVSPSNKRQKRFFLLCLQGITLPRTDSFLSSIPSALELSYKVWLSFIPPLLAYLNAAMEKTQQYRMSGTEDIVEITLRQINGLNVILWDDIEDVFSGVKLVMNGTVVISKLRDSNQNR